MQLQRWIRFGAAVALLSFSVAACDEGTGPAADFDAQRAAETMDAMIGALDDDALADAFGSLEEASFLFAGTAAALQSPMTAQGTDIAAFGDLEGADFIPGEYRGATFEWDEGEMSYVMTEAAGAPSDGVRVIFYAIDPTTGTPATPLNELGYVDLRDLSTESSDRLEIEIVHTAGDSDVTLAEYYVDLSFTVTQSATEVDVASVGYVSDGTDQLNFDVSQGLTGTDTALTVTQAYALDLEGTPNAVTFDATVTVDQASQTGDPETMDAEAMITDGSQTVVMEMEWVDGALGGTVFNNGNAVVLVGGDLDTPSFTDTDGNPLTQDQLDALRSVWDHIGNMFNFVENLFGFVSV